MMGRVAALSRRASPGCVGRRESAGGPWPAKRLRRDHQGHGRGAEAVRWLLVLDEFFADETTDYFSQLNHV